MLQVYSAEGGKLKAIARPADAAAFRSALWIDLWDPTPEEARLVEEAAGVHLSSPDETDRFQISDQLQSANGQVTLTALLLTDTDQRLPKFVPVTFVRSKGPWVTVSKGSAAGLSWLVNECDEYAPPETKDVFPVILGMVSEHAMRVLDSVSVELERINRALFQHHLSAKSRSRQEASPRRRNRQLELLVAQLGANREVLVKLRRSVLSFGRLVALMRERHPDDALAPKLEIFERELKLVAEAEEDVSEAAAFMLDGAVGFIGILQNKTINILTVVGVLLTPPVLVASVYGMNFKHMPELDWDWGYAWALGLMVASGVGMYVVSRLRGWL